MPTRVYADIDAGTRRAARNLKKQGKSWEEIGETCGCSRSGIRKALKFREAHFQRKVDGRGRPKKLKPVQVPPARAFQGWQSCNGGVYFAVPTSGSSFEYPMRA